jgi:protein-disulfide isomerase
MQSGKRAGMGRSMVVAAILGLAASIATAAPAPSADAKSVDSTRTSQGAATYDGVPVGFTAEGRAFRGRPDAPVTLIEYTDFVCPFCAMFFQRTLPVLLEKYVRTGRVKLVIADLPLDSLHPTAPAAAKAALCVAEQGAAPYWRMHDVLFGEQQQWGRLPDPAAFFADAAHRAGADGKAYGSCLASGRMDARIRQSGAAATALGFTGTPTFQFVGAKSGKTYTLVGAQPAETFGDWIDTLLAGKEPVDAEAQAQDKPELPFWATPEGLAPDPKHPGLTMAGDRYKGNPKAKLVMVEFADFECPACQRHVQGAQPLLDTRFVDTGEILWVAKHFPLRMHPRAPAAAAAAECAGSQGKFWKMHDALFDRIDRWSEAKDVDAALAKIAVTVGVEPKRFAACLSNRRGLEHVLRDIYDGQAIGVKNLPTFILLHDGAGHVMTGARSADQFAATLQQQLNEANAHASTDRTMARK